MKGQARKGLVPVLVLALLLLGALTLSACQANALQGKTLFLHAGSCADKWEDRYPLGNGTIGVMEKGHPRKDEIGLNDASFWSGTGADTHATHPEGLAAVRALLDAGDVPGAEQTLKQTLLGQYADSYLPLGSLTLKRKKGGVGYSRTLDLLEGVHEVRFGKTKVRSLVSHPAGVYARSETGRGNSATLSFGSQVHFSVRYDGDYLTADMTAPTLAMPNYQDDDNPIRYEGEGSMHACVVLKVVTDGRVQAAGDHVDVNDYTRLDWFLSTSTDFSEGPGYREEARKRVEAAATKGFEEVLQEHVADFRPLMERVTLSLNGADTSPRNTVNALNLPASNKLIVTYFQFGRYLSVAAQRGDYPANLQGIWNQDLRPAWSSNYTLNINAQMNVWGVDTLNLSECGDNLLPYVERLAQRGSVVARESFGLGGWMAGHNSDIWAHAAPVGAQNPANPTSWGYYISAGGWLCNVLYDHYRFSGDLAYLARIRPLMAGALQFYMDYATWDESRGGYIFSPSTSPENCYLLGSEWCSLTREAAMDNQIVSELAANYLALSDVLGEDETTRRVRAFAPGIAPTKFGADGRVLEWGEEKVETEPDHRHLSHLYAVYPGTQPVSEQLRQGALATLDVRGKSGTGWSRAWKVALYARLGDGNSALSIIKRQLKRSILVRKNGTYDSLLAAHPPFQIDANYGMAAGIAEMLVQSQSGQVTLLPALPRAWKKGKVTGLKVRGGQTVDVTWEKGKVTDVTYHPAASGQ